MKILKYISTFLLFCANCLAQPSPAYVEELTSYEPTSIQEYLDAYQPEGFGPGIVLHELEAVLHGTVTSSIVIYSYQIGDRRSRSPQYLGVFDKKVNGYSPIAMPVVIGSRGTQYFDELEFKDHEIILTGRSWVEGDGMCCPSKIVQIKYMYANWALIAKGQ